MRIINIVDRLDRVNFGIWNAAIATVSELKKRHQADSEVWFPAASDEARREELNGARPRALQSLAAGEPDKLVREAGLNPENDIIVTHGCWQYPTRWGLAFKEKGFRWVAVPHGMLESWSLSQKRIRKWVYYHLMEKRLLLQADRIRAVGEPEFDTLKRSFGNQVLWIPNGVPSMAGGLNLEAKPGGRKFLFMARLHHKKGILPLVRAWLRSSLAGRKDFELYIAGPDDGELPALKELLARHPEAGNVRYLGGVYGDDKAALLEKCHFYTLPSFSEGFPTSVLEAMQRGLVPIITTGCNFPDVFKLSLGIEVTPEESTVLRGLEEAAALSDPAWADLAGRCHKLIESRYTHARLADEQYDLYHQLLSGNR